nr:phage antirepressor N-terminal domain-containing protein [Volucribacter psittacicida]
MPISKLNGWLLSVNPNKVRAGLKERLEAYQEECFSVLWEILKRVKQKKAMLELEFLQLNVNVKGHSQLKEILITS